MHEAFVVGVPPVVTGVGTSAVPFAKIFETSADPWTSSRTSAEVIVPVGNGSPPVAIDAASNV